ncbi:acetyltransferase, CysE/LacA/LpxA/NodL family [Blumeria hordei DH14]|uniref:Acetyltransferase, CysE/LacA/LpxA/NodL family n=1 Tax=Blumeria graminis f. sp. hordei (strain DH14) TaxID=546991 RepID=N1JIS0_BLUG1|nr:acetyltransferase, CysE/LacA/LpxA/NodL family [Blumeria hordei DH14]
MEEIDEDTNEQRMRDGQLYYAFTPRLSAQRERSRAACQRLNSLTAGSRRDFVRLWREVANDSLLADPTPLPPPQESAEGDAGLFVDDPIIEAPLRADYGHNLKFGQGVYINFNSTFLDVCQISIGSRTLIGPNCSFFAATHPLDPYLRNGVKGPELGAPITVEEDCWFGGNVTVCPGVTIRRGAVIGAGSVVTKDVAAYHVVAGNPARVIRKIEARPPHS